MKPIQMTALFLALLLSACASLPDPEQNAAASQVSDLVPPPAPYTMPGLSRVTARQLEQFGSDTQFLSYFNGLEDVRSEHFALRRAYQNELRRIWNENHGLRKRRQDSVDCHVVDGEVFCADASEDTVIVTGSRIGGLASPVSITNNQVGGVDEGDIVKLIGDHLVLLQDGRLFTVSLNSASGEPPELIDRINVYTGATERAWYDEILVRGRDIIVLGYSYRAGESFVRFFRIDDTGQLTRNGGFSIRSNDYFSSDNYASRIIGDRLVMHIPVGLDSLDFGDDGRALLPRIRFDNDREGRPIGSAGDAYRPLQRLMNPMLHNVVICDVDALIANNTEDCQTQHIVASPEHQFYVSQDAFYLWTHYGYSDFNTYGILRAECAIGGAEDHQPVEAVIYRIEVETGEVGVIGATGRPPDQFSMDERDQRFHALTYQQDSRCRSRHNQSGEWPASFLSLPLRRFDDRPAQVSNRHYTALPALPVRTDIASRFGDEWFIYAPMSSYRRTYDASPVTVDLIAIPIDRPSDYRAIELPHGVTRVDQPGSIGIATGYTNQDGLSFTALELGAEPHIADTHTFTNRYESENRSHAFNFRIDEDGSVLMGLPTVVRESDSGRYAYWSDYSDINFIDYVPGEGLDDLGFIEGKEESYAEGYSCEVSCVDWYGNARPFFIGDRIFALSVVELVEVEMQDGQVAELHRVNITAATGEPVTE